MILYCITGVKGTFKIWWSFHLLLLLNTFVVSNIFIFIDSKANYQELENVNLPCYNLRRNTVHPEPTVRFFNVKNTVNAANENNNVVINVNDVTLESL